MATFTTIATFPVPTFLENLAIRADNSILVTSINTNTVSLIPPFPSTAPPTLIHTFPYSVTGIHELSSDNFYVSVGKEGAPGTASLYHLSMVNYPTTSPTVTHFLSIPDALFLNGSTALGPSTLLLADSTLGLIYRVDLFKPDAPILDTWLSHPFLKKCLPLDPAWSGVPGVNGVRYSPDLHAVIVTNSERRLVLRIGVDEQANPKTPEVIATGILGDDLAIDAEKQVAYITTHVTNSLVSVKLDALALEIEGEGAVLTVKNSELVAGGMTDRVFAGSTACVWSRAEGEVGKVLYVTTEGGIVMPVGGETGVARVLRVEV